MDLIFSEAELAFRDEVRRFLNAGRTPTGPEHEDDGAPSDRVAQVIGDEWMYPNDPRLAQLNEVSAG